MKKLLVLPCLPIAIGIALAAPLFSQTKAAPEQSDPAAKTLLDKVRKKYEGYKSVEVGFDLSVELPGEATTKQKGTIAQQGDQFRLDMPEQLIICDGKVTWVYLKKQNEVQINDASAPGEETAFLTPRDLLKRYQKGDFLFAITDKTTEGGKVLTQIEFKPVDKKSEYAKIRLSVDAAENRIASIKAFAKDGSRYTFKITRLNGKAKFPTGKFTFDKAAYPGVKVEDLRM